ncbi:MAG: hypothetical protein MUF51_02705 [Vicinamibacteria bacterium]|jgi:HlyD family secretion protein|nr:hypothetical protein [Vicinamibacteria bacterium]
MFRKAAIDKVSSPEQLDLMMQVTSPMGWLALLTMAMLLGMIGLWGLFGSIPDLVDGQGVLMRGERLYEVKASMAGTVTRVNVTTGTDVTANQVVAVINRDKAGIEEREADELTLTRTESMIATKRAELASLEEQRATQVDLVNRGLKAGNALFEFDRKVNAVRGELNSLEREYGVLKSRVSSTSEITVPEAGRVVEVIKSFGDKVREGEPLLRLELTGGKPGQGVQREFCKGNIHAILFVPGQLAGKVRARQRARVSPLDVKKEEYGYIMGEVEWVASYPSSPDDMREKLKNDALVQTFAGSGPVYEARVCLTADPKNKANGLKWSSSRGPNQPIGAGSQCMASMVVDQRRPFTYIVPSVKRTLGL